MTQNCDFFAKNQRFKGLIEYYARKLGEREAVDDFWGFLWLLQATSFLPNDRYIAVCLRNYFIKKSKEKAKHSLLPITEENAVFYQNFDLKLDIQNLAEKLNNSEKAILHQRFVDDLTLEDIAKLNGTTRQNESQKIKRTLAKLRRHLSDDNLRS